MAVGLLLALLVTTCGESSSEPTIEEREKAAVAAAAKERAESAREKVNEAMRLAGDGKTAEAWAVWREARAVTGETPDLAKVATVIRNVERKARQEEELAHVLDVLNRDAKAQSEEERLEILKKAAEAARAYLETYPEDEENKEEIAEGLKYADNELKLHSGFVEAMKEAREHFRAERYEKCIESCVKAISILDRKSAHELRTRARKALTPEGMVFIPEGFFRYGKDRIRTFLGAYYIDKTEVTNARYAEFVKATKRKPPKHWKDGKIPAGKAEHPVSHVKLEDALAFATWAKKRLPTEREWERAARGTDGRNYPWGEEWDPEKGNFAPKGTVPVGSKAFDRAPEGVMDMAGNVMEMTLPDTDVHGEHDGPVMRGGHWSDDFHPQYARTFARYLVDREHEGSGSGFRCALPAK